MDKYEVVRWLGRICTSTKCINTTLMRSNTIERLWNLPGYIAEPYTNRKLDNSTPLVMTAGNGGSHALAEYLTGALTWRLGKDQDIRIPSVCLTSNSSVLTSLSDDIGYIEALSYYAGTLNWLQDHKKTPQILIAFSSSGHSKNIFDLLESTGYDYIVHRVLFTGPRQDKEIPAEEIFSVEGSDNISASVIQEVHQVYVHILCEMISERLENV